MLSLVGYFFLYINLSLISIFFLLQKKIAITSSKSFLILISFTGCMPFVALLIGFMTSDFSIVNVAKNSFIDDPLFFKMASAWGSHEGSILLWIFIINIYLFFFIIFNNDLKKSLSIILVIEFSFILYVLISSDPFAYIDPLKIDKGLGLNPVLQHLLFLIHPPILFIGYIGLIIPFSISAYILISKDFSRKNFKYILIWTKISWLFLTLGISLGSYWAYSELGWGGWWFWDPVENVSLIPWLLTTALIHSCNVSIKKKELMVWTLNLCLYGFIASVFGTFLVRSNLIISVHSFASDPLRGLYLIAIISYLLAFTFYLNIKSTKLLGQDQFSLISRESFLLFNNVFFIAAAITVFIGTIYPIFTEFVQGQKISVGAPYYNFTFNIILAPGILLMALAPQLSWGYNKSKKTIITKLLIASLFISCFSFYFLKNFNFALAVFLSAPILITSIGSINFLLKNMRVSLFAQWLSHLSIALFILSAVYTEQFDKDYNIEFSKATQTSQKVNNKTNITLDNIYEESKSNHQKIIADLTLNYKGKKIKLNPSKNVYEPSGQVTTEVSKNNYYLDNFYTTISSISPDYIVLNLVHKPFIDLLWLSTLLLVLGITLSIFRKNNEYE